mmetsp:Transcript_22500/g.39875  ORF Transcript_22500/g.39875 Transcript_22500/m.39875 type:complete len:131 (+) Transcript_22500:155-547(+)
MGIDPKVFFANERTYLHWLNVSVTIGSIGSALLGFAGIAAGETAPGGFGALRTIGLVMICIAILFCAHSMYQFKRRARLLRKRSGSGYDDSSAPVALSLVLVTALSAIYVSYVMKSTESDQDQLTSSFSP